MTCSRCSTETFRYRVVAGESLCAHCADGARGHNVAGSVFPYQTTAFDGTTTTVNSLYHLRQLERQHGVACTAFSRDSRNWDAPPQTDFMKICGRVRSGLRHSV